MTGCWELNLNPGIRMSLYPTSQRTFQRKELRLGSGWSVDD